MTLDVILRLVVACCCLLCKVLCVEHCCADALCLMFNVKCLLLCVNIIDNAFVVGCCSGLVCCFVTLPSMI